MEKFTYQMRGTCASQVTIYVQGDVVERIEFTNGCAGNTLGIANLVAGMKIEEIITRLQGITCGAKATSCPDQLAQGLKRVLAERQASVSAK